MPFLSECVEPNCNMLFRKVDQELLEITRLERLRELEEKKTRRAAENTKQTSDRCQEASKDQGDDEIVETDFEAKMLQQIREVICKRWRVSYI